jgi:hypothetical protein
MSSRRQQHITGAVVVGLALCASGALGQTQARVPATGADLSTALEATARLVSPAVVEIFTTSYAPGEGVVPRTADLVTHSGPPDPASSSIPMAVVSR